MSWNSNPGYNGSRGHNLLNEGILGPLVIARRKPSPKGQERERERKKEEEKEAGRRGRRGEEGEGGGAGFRKHSNLNPKKRLHVKCEVFPSYA